MQAPQVRHPRLRGHGTQPTNEGETRAPPRAEGRDPGNTANAFVSAAREALRRLE